VRRFMTVLLLIPALVAACGGGGAPTAAPGQPTQAPGQPTQAPGQPTSPPAQTTPAPVGGATTVSVTLTGGAHAGTYTGTADPLCSNGFMGEGVWGTQYSVFEGIEAGELSSLQLIYNPVGAQLKTTVGIGPIFDTANGYTEYDITFQYEGQDDSGTGTVQVTDGGTTAVLHVTGTTADGVGIDATVNCPAVTRA
jgi:hypothetical protein